MTVFSCFPCSVLPRFQVGMVFFQVSHQKRKEKKQLLCMCFGSHDGHAVNFSSNITEGSLTKGFNA